MGMLKQIHTKNCWVQVNGGFYGSLNGDVSGGGRTAQNGGIASDWWTGRDEEGSGLGKTSAAVRGASAGLRKTTEKLARRAVLRAQISVLFNDAVNFWAKIASAMNE
jgi:hypothetical protein